MESEQLDYTNTFRNLSMGLSEIETPELNSEIAKSWIQSFQKRHEKEDRDKSNKAMAMKQINPKFRKSKINIERAPCSPPGNKKHQKT